jgi:hypothetical protein
MTRPAPRRHLQWPAERFYWAVLDASVLPTRARWGNGRSAMRLGYLFENVVPGVPIEDVHSVYRRLKGRQGRFVACGVPFTVLEGVDPDAVTLRPRSLPSFIQEDLDPARLNVLTGPYLPGAVRRLRRRWLAHIGVMLVVCVGALLVGAERRVGAVGKQHDDVIAARTLVLEQVLGPQTRTTGSSQPPELRLTAELRRLEQTRNPDVAIAQLANGSSILNELLSRWPGDVHARTESIVVAPASITVRATVDTMADAQRFADAFVGLRDWRLRQPRSESRRGHVDVTLRFERDGLEVTP